MTLPYLFDDCPKSWQNLIDSIENEAGPLAFVDQVKQVLSKFDAECIDLNNFANFATDSASVQFNTESGYLMFMLKYS